MTRNVWVLLQQLRRVERAFVACQIDGGADTVRQLQRYLRGQRAYLHLSDSAAGYFELHDETEDRYWHMNQALKHLFYHVGNWDLHEWCPDALEEVRKLRDASLQVGPADLEGATLGRVHLWERS